MQRWRVGRLGVAQWGHGLGAGRIQSGSGMRSRNCAPRPTFRSSYHFEAAARCALASGRRSTLLTVPLGARPWLPAMEYRRRDHGGTPAYCCNYCTNTPFPPRSPLPPIYAHRLVKRFAWCWDQRAFRTPEPGHLDQLGGQGSLSRVLAQTRSVLYQSLATVPRGYDPPSKTPFFPGLRINIE